MGKELYHSPSIDQSVGLLNIIGKSKLEELRARFPNHKEILEIGQIAGPEDISIDELTARYELTKTTLETTLSETKEYLIPKLRKKLKKLRTIELWSQIIILISSCSIFVLLNQNFEGSERNPFPYIAAGLSTLGALFTIFIKKDSGEWAMNNRNVANSFDSIITNRIRAEEILREITVLSKFMKDNVDKLTSMIERANTLNAEMIDVIEKYY